MPPPSLKNIFTEIHSDLGIDFDMSVGELTDWARQGVLMLNTSLTVREVWREVTGEKAGRY